MANPFHVSAVKKGPIALIKWRLNNPDEKLELSHADLSMAELSHMDLYEANLSGANLKKANLFAAGLSFANLSKANLAEANLAFSLLTGTNLTNADLSKSDLGYSNMQYVSLPQTNLTGADLTGATLCSPKAESTNLKNTIMKDTNLIGCEMSNFENLETVKHKGPSNIDVATLILSLSAEKEFKTKLEPFFLNAGVPKSLLDSLPDIVEGITYCNCFVCYGEPDTSFAEKLVQDLRAEEIGCWIYSMDSTPGEKIWKEITRKRREADKMIVLCSVKSLIRDGVKKEIEEQMDEDPER